MKSIKSIFISTYLTVLVVGLLLSIWKLSSGIDWRWLGVISGVAPMLVFFAWLFLLRPARTSATLPVWQAATLLGALFTLAANLVVGVELFTLVFVPGFAVAGLYLYIFWYSRYQRVATVLPGSTFPAITLQQLDGTDITLDTFLGGPLVLMFYRGNWCPLCMAQIREVAEQYQKLEQIGARVALVSPQPADHSRELAAQFGVNFEFLVDRDHRAARSLGILDAGNTPAGLEVLGYDADTVMPTVYVLDKHGTVLFAHLTDNYRVRPEPELFLRVLAEQGGT